MQTTRRIIEELAKEYLEDENYHQGFVYGNWVKKLTDELGLEKLSDLELANMWDMVYLTLDNEFHYYDRNKDYEQADKYRDVTSAFTEIVNLEARNRRKGRKEYE